MSGHPLGLFHSHKLAPRCIISNGLNLIGLSSFWQLVVKGLIIVLAVIIDTQKGKDSVVKRIIRNAKERV